jgi:hypothetical protein
VLVTYLALNKMARGVAKYFFTTILLGMMTTKADKEALNRAIAAAGSMRKFAAAVGVTHQAVSQWRRIPAELVVKAEKASGIAREELRPDLYRRE